MHALGRPLDVTGACSFFTSSSRPPARRHRRRPSHVTRLRPYPSDDHERLHGESNRVWIRAGHVSGRLGWIRRGWASRIVARGRRYVVTSRSIRSPHPTQYSGRRPSRSCPRTSNGVSGALSLPVFPPASTYTRPLPPSFTRHRPRSTTACDNEETGVDGKGTFG